MWLGPQYRLDLTVLEEDLDGVPLQYPELGLGYSAYENDTPRLQYQIHMEVSGCLTDVVIDQYRLF